MGGKAPIGILTIQDVEIRKALRSTMKDTCHRWCLWHIVHKFGQKLGKHEEYFYLKDDLDSAIYDSLDPEEFEANWNGVIERYKLEDDKWLAGLYDEREMWVPAYLKHLFWAGMKTTQRVKSINNFFDGIVRNNTRLYEFAEGYVEAMESRVEVERLVDASSARLLRQLVSAFPVEEVFQKCYTDAKFKEVQRECSRVLYLNCVEMNEVSKHVTEYIVGDRV